MSFVEDFKKFTLRGNLVELAIGFTVGAAFTTVAKSLVADVLMPPIGLIFGDVDFSELFWVLKEGSTPPPYSTMAEAKSIGAVTLNYGSFLNNAISLLVVAVAMFFLVRFVNRLDAALEGDKMSAEDTPSNKKCPHCVSTIAFKATRCPHCTSELA